MSDQVETSADALRRQVWREAGEETARRLEAKEREDKHLWYAANREKIIRKVSEARRKRIAESPEKERERARKSDQKWKSANPEKVREINRKWKSANPEKVRESYRKWDRAKLERMATRPRTKVCEACGRKPKKGKSLHFDHCHLFGRFRGWLCGSCNWILGLAEDNPSRLKALIVYLKRYDHV